MIFRKQLVLFLLLLLTGCASVDQFGSRINDVNANSGDALNDETLLNIVRAANYQGPHFVAISQVTGGQTESLATGLPNVNFGVLAATDKAYHLTNSITSGLSSGFTSAPIVTSQFEQGILAPLDGRQLLLLLGAYPIESVYYALIESITVKYQGRDYQYLANPLYNRDANDQYDPDCQEKQKKVIDKTKITATSICNYEKFQNLLSILIKAGLSVELLPPDTKPSGKNTSVPTSAAISAPSVSSNANTTGDKASGSASDQAKAASNQSAKAQFCFLSSQFKLYSDKNLLETFRCGSGNIFPKHLIVKFDNIGDIEIESFGIRSLSGILNFLGKIEREKTSDKVTYRSTQEGESLNKSGSYLDIQEGFGPDCIAEAAYAGHRYCVHKGAYNTALLINIIEQIRNLQISPSDLNAPFTVRLTGGI